MFGDIGFPKNLTNLKPDASQVTWVLGKDLVAVYVPYEWFGMKSGDVIRLAYTDEKSSNDGLSEVRRVNPK